MWSDRERTLARRWGLVTLTAVAICVVRLLRTLIEEAARLQSRADLRLLESRMSQLKPLAWKAPALFVYGGLTIALVGGVVVVLFVLGVRDALRDD